MDDTIHPVDEKLPLPRLGILGLQHLLAMYAGAVTVPLVLAGALGLSRDATIALINADLIAGGLVSIIQSLGVGAFGIRYPMMMGVTFVAIGPMIAIGLNPALGLQGIFGAVIVAGIVGLLLAPLMARLLRYFPPVVTGSVILVIGVSLMGVGIHYSGGGYGVPDFGRPAYIGIAAFVLLAIVAISRYANGFVANVSVLLGILLGFLLAFAVGFVKLDGLAEAPWFAMVYPFQFGLPKFDLLAAISMSLVMIVTLIESMGGIFALADIIDKKPTQTDLVRGLRTDGLGAIIGGIFNTFPYTSYSQNIGLVHVSGIRSRYVCVAAGVLMILLGFVPKIAFVVASIPHFVLGGAAFVMFGMVAANGIRILQSVDFRGNRHNLMIVAVSLGMGMIPMVSDKYFAKFPPDIGTLLNSSIALCAVTAILLNYFANGAATIGTVEAAIKDSVSTTH
ncbi:nucleobase:cation symporter-2 family protein [Paraburkholderia sp.]|uniref:nucleobase:cation symporter-2 family protein n=1 Tax=Paraburkholderia sp. TaxID=1926495 RepID=UPI002D6CD06D|nr:nucleobase:cation symporter-2 family protein [Paraburkholderia sp.]HZZ05594.1 nucleobase:cation symporter-2 family protein [Paraburkholderia sp.]